MSTELIKEVTLLLKHCFKFIPDTGSRQYIKVNEKYNINILVSETASSYANIELDSEEKYTVLQIIADVQRKQDYRSSFYNDHLCVCSNFSENKIVYKNLYTHEVIDTYNYKISSDEYNVLMFNANLLYDSSTVRCLELAYKIPKIMERKDLIHFKTILKYSTKELEDLVQALKNFINEHVPVKFEDAQ
ncbi:hypothetical protein P9J96_000326 [Escherichia coli]|nr:hypothetical protein [Escherichia coli]ELQ3159141.1 hypothetical protein [Escherichia coli]